MALDVSPDKLYEEIRLAEKLRNEHVEEADKIVRDYVGSYWKKSSSPDQTQLENHSFEFISLMLGRLVADNPAAMVNSYFPSFDQIAYGLEDSLNTWIRRNRLAGILECAVLDAFFCFGVLMTTFEEDPGGKKTGDGARRMVPRVHHVPYHRYFRDPESSMSEFPRFQGHVWKRDKEDLLRDPRFDKEAVRRLAVDVDLEKYTGKKPGEGEKTERKEIVGYEIWVPDAKVEGSNENTHGALFTLAVCVSDKEQDPKFAFIRKPRPYFGHPNGPYIVFGGWPVPNSPYPLSPLAATEAQAKELNIHVSAIARSAIQQKKIVIVPSSENGLAGVLANGKHGHVYKVKGFVQGKHAEIEIGGPTESQVAYSQMARDRLDRNSGINDAQRGNLDPRVTATANNIAAQASSIRIDYQVRKVRESTITLLNNAAWLMYHSDNFVSLISREGAEKFPGMKTPMFGGGEHPESEGLNFEDLAIDIQPYSLERVDPLLQQQRVQQVTMLFMQSAQAMPTLPWVNFKIIFDQLARAHNFTWAKDIIKQDVFQKFMELQANQKSETKPPPMAYKDTPPDIKAQIETMYGFKPSSLWSMTPLYDPNQPPPAEALPDAEPIEPGGDLQPPQPIDENALMAQMMGEDPAMMGQEMMAGAA
jgi:hypothetical protein